MIAPELWIVAGPNGAGKTTCVQKIPASNFISSVAFLNPDNVTLEKLRRNGYRGFSDAPVDVQTSLFFESADEVQHRLEAAIERGESVGIETVLSTDKYRKLVERVLELNGRFQLIYVALRTPEIAQARVANRVARGGHGIPNDKIASRFFRSLEKLTWNASRAHTFWVLDNSEPISDKPLGLIALGREGKVKFLADDTFPEMKTALAPLV